MSSHQPEALLVFCTRQWGGGGKRTQPLEIQESFLSPGEPGERENTNAHLHIIVKTHPNLSFACSEPLGEALCCDLRRRRGWGVPSRDWAGASQQGRCLERGWGGRRCPAGSTVERPLRRSRKNIHRLPGPGLLPCCCSAISSAAHCGDRGGRGGGCLFP